MKVTKLILANLLLTCSLFFTHNVYAIQCTAGADDYFCRDEAQAVINTANQALNTANAANSTANAANTTANNANATAQNAQTTANAANTAAQKA
ncbi:hypothetical protein ACX6N0_004215, partial [Salmonella enterica]